MRTLPLVGRFKEYFAEVKAEQELNKQVCGNCYNYEHDGFVFVDELGERMKPDYLTSQFPAFIQRAYNLAKDVIDNGPFELAKDFASIWDMKNSDGNSNNEVIWYVDYSTNPPLASLFRVLIFMLYLWMKI